jgi:hypothetical protein
LIENHSSKRWANQWLKTDAKPCGAHSAERHQGDVAENRDFISLSHEMRWKIGGRP